MYVPIISGKQPARLVIDTANEVQVWLNGQPIPVTSQTKATNSMWGVWILELPGGGSDLVVRLSSGVEAPGIVATLVTDTPLQFGFDVAAQR